MPLDLKKLLGKEAYNLNFFQAVHLLERLFPNRSAVGTADELKGEPVRFETHNSLSFPPGEIASVLAPLSLTEQVKEAQKEKNPGRKNEAETEKIPADAVTQVKEKGAPLRMDLTFMGLYGVSSPLPSYFIDPITLRKLEYFQLRKFLDIFGHRLYSLFYRAWKKYRHPLQFKAGGEDDYTQRLLGLTGQWPITASTRRPKLPPPGRTAEFQALATPLALTLGDLKRIPYARFLGNRVRSAKGLEQLLRGYFGFNRVKVREFVRQSVPIPIPATLGGLGATLGNSMRIGLNMHDHVGRFEVEIGPLPSIHMRRFLPTGQKKSGAMPFDFSQGLAAEIRSMVDTYLRDPFDYAVTVLVSPPEGVQLGLGGGEYLLGMATYMTGDKDYRGLLRLRF